jgi:hypothetical protein
VIVVIPFSSMRQFLQRIDDLFLFWESHSSGRFIL